MSLRKQAVAGTVWTFSSSMGRELFGLLIFFMLARVLGPEAYGLMGMAMVIIAVTPALVGEHVTEVLIQRTELDDAHLDAAFWGLIGVSLLLGVAVIASADPLASFYGRREVGDIVSALAVLPFLTAVSAVPMAILRRQLRFRPLAVRSLVAVSAGGIVGVGMAVGGHGVWSLVGLQIAQKLSDVLVVWVGVSWRPGLRARRRHFRDLQSYAGTMVLIRLLAIAEQQLPRTIVGAFLGATALGYMTIAWRILEIASTVLAAPVTSVAFSVLTKVQNERERVGDILRRVLVVGAAFGLPCFAGAIIVMPDLVALVLGPKWTPTTPVIQILLVMGPLIIVSYLLGATLRALGRPSKQLILLAASVLANVALVWVLRHAELTWIVAALVLRAYAFMPVNIVMVTRMTGQTIAALFRGMGGVIAATAVMSACAVAVRIYAPASFGHVELLVLSVTMGLTAYGLAAALMAREAAMEGWTMVRTLFPVRGALSSSRP